MLSAGELLELESKLYDRVVYQNVQGRRQMADKLLALFPEIRRLQAENTGLKDTIDDLRREQAVMVYPEEVRP